VQQTADTQNLILISDLTVKIQFVKFCREFRQWLFAILTHWSTNIAKDVQLKWRELAMLHTKSQGNCSFFLRTTLKVEGANRLSF